jgi:uncharacterized protein YrzB (UPF0473 family)
MSDTPINPIDALYDENNNDAIILFNEKGEEIAFEQIALIPIAEKVYAILKPIQPMDGVGEDEGLVFSIEQNDEGEEYLMLTVDEEIIDAVFTVYEALVAEEYDEE